MKFIFLVFSSIFLSSCITMHSTSFEAPSVKEINKKAYSYQKIDISFSVNATGEFLPALEDIADTIKKELYSYNIFKKVLYTDNINKTKYHMRFNFYIRNVELGQSFGEISTRILSGLTLYLLPATQDFYTDVSMHLFKDGKKIYMISAPQKLVRLFWLPALLLYPYYNQFIMRNHIFKESTHYFISEILDNHYLME